MSKEQNFLIRYGLHNFVTCVPTKGKRVFSIRGTEGRTMVGHAEDLIEGIFGDAAEIRMV